MAAVKAAGTGPDYGGTLNCPLVLRISGCGDVQPSVLRWVPFPVSGGFSAVPVDGRGQAQIVSCWALQLLIPADAPRGTLEPLPSGCRACPAQNGIILPGVWHC